jgi:hypothetical protein
MFLLVFTEDSARSSQGLRSMKVHPQVVLRIGHARFALGRHFRHDPEVRFEAVNTPSDIFQSHVVIHRVSQFLFASQVMLGRLNRCVPKQKLDLFKFAASQVA